MDELTREKEELRNAFDWGYAAYYELRAKHEPIPDFLMDRLLDIANQLITGVIRNDD